MLLFSGYARFPNEVKHTSNTLNYLKQYAGDKYTGDSNYINEQAVRDENIVTANGTGQLEFCKEILYALEADTADAIEESYLFYKNRILSGRHKMNERMTILKKMEYLSNQKERQ